MRDPNRIDRILAKLSRAWQDNPDWRLGQLVSNAANFGGWSNPDPFYAEDDKTEKGLEVLNDSQARRVRPRHCQDSKELKPGMRVRVISKIDPAYLVEGVLDDKGWIGLDDTGYSPYARWDFTDDNHCLYYCRIKEGLVLILADP